MNREIKFKLYQRLSTATGVPKYVEYTDGFSISQDGKCWYDEHEIERPLGDEWILVQYTGLQDKNGVEIYKGDVVDVQHDECFIVDWFNDNACWVLTGVMTGKVRWIEDRGAFKTESQYSTGELVVIGNIYQNPELIKTA